MFILADSTELVQDLETKVSRPFDFRARDRFGQSPTLDPRLKVLAIDDTTVSWLGGPSPTMADWAKLLLAMGKKKPKVIFIDALFTIANIPAGQEEETRKLIRELEQAEVPVVVGAFIAPRVVRYRKKLELDRKDYELKSMVRSSKVRFRTLNEEIKNLTVVSAEGFHVYGPDPILRNSFQHIGHLMYAGDGKFSLMFRLSEDRVLPHFMLFGSKERYFESGRLYVDGQLIPTYKDGKVPINFSSFKYYLSQTKPLRYMLEDARSGEDLEGIEKGDYVYIIPPFYTGNTDFKLTPFGPMPAGYAHLAFLNSLLKNEWLKPIWVKEILIVLLALVGGFVARTFRPLGLSVAVVLGVFSWIAIAVFCFSFHGTIIPWLLPMLCFLAVAMTVSLEKSRIAEKKSQFIRNCLDGVIASEQVNSLAKNPELLNFSAREQVVTVMFIDVVGFSVMSENQLPRIAFDQLKTILGEISQKVHQFGGVVNKNLGDGLLCFFGYSMETSSPTSDHAESAIACATAIQRMNLPRGLTEYERGGPVFPLRIGVNTSSVFVGNIGTEDRIDFTVVGNGVNFSKRLEGACPIHSVLMGVTTHELIRPLSSYQTGLSRKYIRIKHHEEMVEAWEYDPFHSERDLKERSVDAHLKSINRLRSEKRWDVDPDADVRAKTNIGEGRIINFSRTGMSIALDIEVLTGGQLKIRLDNESGELGKKLEEAGFGVISAEVCWTLNSNKSHVHGLRYRSLSEVQSANLSKTLEEFLVSPNQAQKVGS